MSETRVFTGVGTFPLTYDYNLGGELKKITDATNMTINYSYDNTGQLIGVTGSDNLYDGVSQYATGFVYRAWGGIKQMTDGASRTFSLSYNPRLQPSHFDLSGGAVSQDYDYYNDGRMKFIHNTTDPNFDRSFSYDHVARLTEAKSGAQANGGYGDIPYHETFSYDTWSNTTYRLTETWNEAQVLEDFASYTNRRRDGWGYNADGRNTTIDTRTYNFDAASQQILMTGQRWVINHYVNVSLSSAYDGDGNRVKETTSSGASTYYLTSSALAGAVVEELNSSGQKQIGYVYNVGGGLLARQFGDVSWKHSTPAGTGEYYTGIGGSSTSRTEFDPVGADVSLTGPPTDDTGGGQGDIGGNHFGGPMYARFADMFNLSSGCTLDGVATPCSLTIAAVNSGSAEPCPNNECSRYNPNLRNGLGGFEYFHSHADGHSGYLPQGATYVGGGHANDPTLLSYSGTPGDNTSETERDSPRNVFRWDPPANDILLAKSVDWSFITAAFGFLQLPPQKPKTPYVDRQVLSDCVDMLFGVTMTSFQQTERGRTGSFTGIGFDVINHGGNSATYTIYNDVTRYSLAALKTAAGNSNKNERVTGLSDPAYPWTNYTANNLSSTMEILKTQAHELGHSLDVITGIRYKDKLDDKGKPIEAGFKLEGCVAKYGGFKYK